VSVTGAPAGEPEIAYRSLWGIEALCAVRGAPTVLIPVELTGDDPDGLYLFWGLAWSPDGARLAFYGRSHSLNCGLHIVRGSGAVCLGDTQGSGDSPAWSPDGSQLAFVRSDYLLGSSDIWLINPDGSGATNLTQGNPALAAAPAWSPDGSRLVFSGEGRVEG